MSSPKPSSNKAVLFLGDPVLVEDTILSIKRKYFPKGATSSEWVSFEPPEGKVQEKKFMESSMNTIGAEICSPPMEGTKFVVVKHMPSNKSFIDFATRHLKLIPDENKVIFWDYDGNVIGSMAKWSSFVGEVEKIGQVVRKEPPLSAIHRREQEKAVADMAVKAGRPIAADAAALLLDMVGADRRLLRTELEKMCGCVDEKIERKDVEEYVFPMSSDFPIYHFSTAVNRGSFAEVMAGADHLVENGLPYDIILSFALKQLRWHLVCAYALNNGHNGRDALKSLGRAKSKDEILDKVNIKSCVSGMFPKREKEAKYEALSSDYSLSDIVQFVDDYLPKVAAKRAPAGVSARAWTLKNCINRYMEVHEAMVDCRYLPKESAGIFARTARNVFF